MIGKSLVALQLAWGRSYVLLLNEPPIIRAAASEKIPHNDKSSILHATRRRHDLLLAASRRLQTTSSSSTSPPSDGMPLTDEQFLQCKYDLSGADRNRDGRLDISEYLFFLSLNSASYDDDTAWGYAGGQSSLEQLPLEFAMLFHSTGGLFVDVEDDGLGCCEGDAGHINVYGNMDDGGGDGVTMTGEQGEYTRLFCDEAHRSYGATFGPTRGPTTRPTVGPTVPATVPPTGSPTARPVDAVGPTTTPPTPAAVTATNPPTTGAPNYSPTTGAPTKGAVPTTASPVLTTAAPVTSPPTPMVTSPT
eukprot:CAMPEP_0181129988 /NCGR_PEP_ID=MMETSP1071-20121207/29617_1 /TAXON_ID=35127 /ORGANISM="Thalassiosira sp., Strain NH16" /LENGTH=304 /DNA_ID=CAMNT_0023216015 /DNA_START=231 /DNA_END=1141 /DNA_ORIENTATION=+